MPAMPWHTKQHDVELTTVAEGHTIVIGENREGVGKAQGKE